MHLLSTYLRYVGVCLLSLQAMYAQQRPLSLNYLSPEIYTIDSIIVTGAKGMKPSVLIAISGLEIGDKIKIPGTSISQAIKNIWNQGIVDHVDVQATQFANNEVWLYFKIKEKPRLTRFSFSGVRRTAREELLPKLETTRGRTLTDALRKQTENTIRQHYHDKGYLDVKLRLSVRRDTTIAYGARLHVFVKRGPKFRVRNMRITGQHVFAQKTLKKQLDGVGEKLRFTLPRRLISDVCLIISHPIHSLQAIHAPPLPRQQRIRIIGDYLHRHANLNFFKSRKFDTKDYEEGKNKLITFLQAKGYRNAYIPHDTVYRKNDKIDIDIAIYLGNKHYIRNVRWVGNSVYDSSKLTNTLGVQRGDVYDSELIARRLTYNPQGQDVSTLYLDNGYLFFNVKPVEVRVENDSIDVEMRVYEGQQANIERVIVKGNNRTQEHVIRRELRTLPGNLFKRSDIVRSMQRLSQLPFINAEETKPVPVPNPATQKVDMEWHISEKTGDQVELSAGWGGGVGFVGSVGFVLNNFSLSDVFTPSAWRPLPVGAGQRLSIRLRSNGRAFSSFSTSFTEPWLGGHRQNNLTVAYNFSRERYFSNDEIIGAFALHGFNVNLVRALKWPDDYFSLGYYAIYKGYLLDNAIDRSLGFSSGRANSFSLALTLARNSVDNPLYPRLGSHISLRADLTPPYSVINPTAMNHVTVADKYRWVEFYKWIFDVKTYMSIVHNLVLESRFHFGSIGRYSAQGTYTPFERFTLGGDGLGGQNFVLGTEIIGLRGYPNNSIAPIDPLDNIQGGLHFAKAVFELRYLFLQLPVGMVYGLLFAEAGNSWLRFQDVSVYGLYRSAGVGLRLNIPAIGIVGLDWGVPLDNLYGLALGESQFHLSIGTSFR